MLGCFGRRKKKTKHDSKQPIDRAQKGAGDDQETPAKPQPQSASAAASTNNSKPQQQVAVAAPKADSNAEPAPVTETITVARAQSLHQEAPVAKQQQQQQQQQPGSIGVRKAATLGRYDFLKRYDRDSYNDRWNTLKQQYLSPRPASAANGEVQDSERGDATDSSSPISPPLSAPPKPARPLPLRVQALPPAKLPLSPGFLANARSLPRQFSPPSTVVSPVKFSNWFHERKIREEEAHKDCHDREERMQLIIEGPTQQQKEDAAAKIQAGFKGHRARVEFKKKREEQKRIEEAKKKEAAAAEAAAAEAAAAEAAAEAAAAEAAANEAAAAEAAAAEAAAAEAAANEAATAEAAATETAAATEASAAETTAAEAAAADSVAAETTATEAVGNEAANETAGEAVATTAETAELSETTEPVNGDSVQEEPVDSASAPLQDDQDANNTEQISNKNGQADAADEDKLNAEAAVKIQAGFRDEASNQE
ncbi:hypothetical protein BOX15_Mlig019204g1 [Macrostomum lignano]|uniref:Uncharacterized protein n=1 Tax=Macrostomum lignano TaxID=282301 RepID=A0A267GNE3_9PLAT|nr:hypothetical protein BOX15_Mlig019204g1 [Macrostomum lignano]